MLRETHTPLKPSSRQSPSTETNTSTHTHKKKISLWPLQSKPATQYQRGSGKISTQDLNAISAVYYMRSKLRLSYQRDTVSTDLNPTDHPQMNRPYQNAHTNAHIERSIERDIKYVYLKFDVTTSMYTSQIFYLNYINLCSQLDLVVYRYESVGSYLSRYSFTIHNSTIYSTTVERNYV